jgi:hypothetical protein
MNTEELRELVAYDPETGVLTRRVTLASNAQAGQPITGVVGEGYIQCVIKGQFFLGHRLAWQLHYGVVPAGHIDHINGNRADNRICNLRLATRSENLRNSKLRRDSVSGTKGVFWSAARKRWIASFAKPDGRRFWKACQTLADAQCAVIEARTALHGQFANHGTTTTP